MNAREAARLDLQLEFIREELTVVSLKASHASDNIHIADFVAAERDIEWAIASLKRAAASFRFHQKECERLNARGKPAKDAAVKAVVEARAKNESGSGSGDCKKPVRGA